MTTPRDPSGILGRVPELESFATDPAIRRAIERGSPHGIYRALFWARWLGRIRTDEAKKQADALLGHRRLFLEPLRGAPGMFTFNGVGTGIYGRQEAHDDGAYVTTLYFCVLFIPIIPIGAYLVADAGGRSYRFFARAPLGTYSFVWGAALVLAASCAALLAAVSAVWSSRHATVYVVDGLPFPIVAQIGDQRVDVAAESQASVVVGSGPQHVTITALDGRVIESGDLEARAGEDVLAWNVLGAAPLYLEQVTYGPDAASLPPPPEPEVACGHSDIHWGSVDYAFVDPPQSIQMSSQYARSETRTHADVAPGGFSLCASVLASRGRYADASALVLRIADAETDPNTTVGLAQFAYAVGASAEDVLPTYSRLHESLADDLDIQRVYQDAMVSAGRWDQVRAEYEARAAAAPDSPDAAYLAARMMAGAETLARITASSERFPDHVPTQRGYAYALYDAHRCAEALEVWSRPVLAGPGGEGGIPFRAACLVEQGRAVDAAALVDSAASPQLASFLANAYAGSARAAGLGMPQLVLSRADFGQDTGARLRATLDAGISLPPSDWEHLDGADRDLTELYVRASTDPDRALELARSLPITSIRVMPDALFALLYAESCRRDPSSQTSQSLGAGSPIGPGRAAWIRDWFVNHTEAPLAELTPDVRASVWVVAARASSGDEAAVFRDRIAADDLLGSWASRAANGWPPP